MSGLRFGRLPNMPWKSVPIGSAVLIPGLEEHSLNAGSEITNHPNSGLLFGQQIWSSSGLHEDLDGQKRSSRPVLNLPAAEWASKVHEPR